MPTKKIHALALLIIISGISAQGYENNAPVHHEQQSFLKKNQCYLALGTLFATLLGYVYFFKGRKNNPLNNTPLPTKKNSNDSEAKSNNTTPTLPNTPELQEINTTKNSAKPPQKTDAAEILTYKINYKINSTLYADKSSEAYKEADSFMDILASGKIFGDEAPEKISSMLEQNKNLANAIESVVDAKKGIVREKSPLNWALHAALRKKDIEIMEKRYPNVKKEIIVPLEEAWYFKPMREYITTKEILNDPIVATLIEHDARLIPNNSDPLENYLSRFLKSANSLDQQEALLDLFADHLKELPQQIKDQALIDSYESNSFLFAEKLISYGANPKGCGSVKNLKARNASGLQAYNENGVTSYEALITQINNDHKYDALRTIIAKKP